MMKAPIVTYMFLIQGLMLTSCQQQFGSKTFTQWCESQHSVPQTTKNTINLLLRIAKTSDCQAADSTLRKLTNINLHRSGVSDIEPLASLTELTNLDLSNNEVVDLRPLSGLKNLTSLNLYENKISNVHPLDELTNLTYLDLGYNNQLSDNDISALNQRIQVTNQRRKDESSCVKPQCTVDYE